MPGRNNGIQRVVTGLSVSWKGFLMVGVPLILQLVCLGTLGWLVGAQSTEVENHFHVRVMQENMSAMVKSALDTGLSVVKYKLKNDPQYLKQFDDALAGAHEAMDALDAEAKPNEQEYVNKVRKDFGELTKFATEAKDSMTNESRIEALGSGIHLKKAGGKIVNKLQEDIAELEQELLTNASEGPGKIQASAKYISILIFAASSCACFLAFLVHRFFTDSITERLKTLTDNTIRLARSEALHPPDPGTDEIGHLDRVFHDMANALAEAARKERAVIQHALDVICSIDAEGRFAAVSPASLQVWGFAPEELIGRTMFEMVAPDDLTATHINFARVRDEEMEPQPFETKVVKKDGTVVHILWSAYWAASEQSMFCVAHDITDRKMAEDQLRASEARVRKIIESAPVALFVLDEKGSVNLMNPRAESMFGYQMEEMIDKSFGMLLPKSAEFAPDSFTQETLEQLVGRIKEMEALRRSGKLFPVELTFDHYQTAEGERYLAAVLDVTERHEMERLKREFVSTVSHELRTPLTAIRGSLTLLAVGALGQMSDQADKAVKIAERNCLRLIGLINDLLDIEKLEAGKLEMEFENADIMPVLERSAEAVKAFAEQYGVKLELARAESKVFADADRLVQVLVNLLSNAVKYSPREGTVRVALDVLPNSLRVSVIDQGRGIPEAFKAKVFERFEQVETMDSKKKGGTGLGLAICKAIVEQHNGTIGVDSEEGKGSTFWFEIPLAGSPAAQRLVKSDAPSPKAAVVIKLQEQSGSLRSRDAEQAASLRSRDEEPTDSGTVINLSETNKVAEEIS